MKNIIMTVVIIVAVLVIAAAPATAQEYDTGGYFKTLLIHRLRTEFTVWPNHSLEFYTALDNQLRWGSYLDTEQWALARPLEDRYYIDMTLDPLDSASAQWRSELYRLYLRGTSSRAGLISPIMTTGTIRAREESMISITPGLNIIFSMRTSLVARAMMSPMR